jgi:hypothetical protein
MTPGESPRVVAGQLDREAGQPRVVDPLGHLSQLDVESLAVSAPTGLAPEFFASRSVDDDVAAVVAPHQADTFAACQDGERPCEPGRSLRVASAFLRRQVTALLVAPLDGCRYRRLGRRRVGGARAAARRAPQTGARPARSGRSARRRTRSARRPPRRTSTARACRQRSPTSCSTPARSRRPRPGDKTSQSPPGQDPTGSGRGCCADCLKPRAECAPRLGAPGCRVTR